MHATRLTLLISCLLAACSSQPVAGSGVATPTASSPPSAAAAGPVAPAVAAGPVTPAVPPRADAAPSAAGPAAPSPAARTPAPLKPQVDASGAVATFDLPAGTTAGLERAAGAGLTVVVGAATSEGTRHDFRFAVGPGTSSYHVQSVKPRRQGVPCSVAPPINGGELATGRTLLQSAPRAVGSTETFWINTGDFQYSGDRQQTCTLKIVTPSVYVYVDQTASAQAQANVQAMADAFASIKTRDEAVYGAPAGIAPDGESRVFLVISPAVDNFGKLQGREGYFWSRDLITGQTHANFHRAVFVADDVFKYPSVVYNGVLGHEYMHLLSFTRKTAANGDKPLSEESWLDEGMAIYAQQVAGYGLPAGDRFIGYDISLYEKDQASYGLLDWTGNPTPAFGQSYLFVHYMVDRFGIGVLRELIDNPQVGQANVEAILTRHGSHFADFFRDWILTNYLNGTPAAQGTRYNYANLDLAGNVDTFQMPGFQPNVASGAVSGQLKPWSSQAFRVSGTGPWHVDLGGSPTARLLGGAW